MGKGKKKSSSSNKTSTNTRTITATNNSNKYLDQENAGQAVASDISNIVDSSISLSIQNNGLSGEQLKDLLEPAAGALESISRDAAATKSVVAAGASAVSNVADATKEAFSNVSKNASKVAGPLAVGAVVYYMLKNKRAKKSG